MLMGGGIVSQGTGGSGRAAFLAVLVFLGGCATRGDLRELRYEVRSLGARQDSAFQALLRTVEGANGEALDSVAELAALLFELRGEVNNRLLAIQDQQLIMGELVGQSQHSLALMTEELNRQRQQIERVYWQQSADTSGAVAEGGGEPSETTLPPDPDEEAYESVRALIDRGSYSLARSGFEQFLEEYPNSPFAAGAYLHLAELKAQDDEVEDAIGTYLAIPALFPEAEEVPRALYQAGLLCISIDDFSRAREYLEWLLESYPDSRLAPQARERLEKIP